MKKTASFDGIPPRGLELMAARFRALGEASRLKLLLAVRQGEKNVTELIAATGLNQANVSKHLKILADANILSRRRDGINIYYSVSNQNVYELLTGSACRNSD